MSGGADERWFAGPLSALRCVAAAELSHQGDVIRSNDGFRLACLGPEARPAERWNASACFMSPTWAEIAGRERNREVHKGLFTITSLQKRSCTLHGSARPVAAGWFFLAEHDPDDWHRLERTVLRLNGELAEAHRKLAGELVARKRAEAEIRRHAADLETVNGELRAANADLERTGNLIAHDLRSPLGAIQLAVAALDRTEKAISDRGRAMVAQITETITHANQLIDHIRDFAHIGSRPLEVASCPCEVLVDRALANLAHEIDASDAAIEWSQLPTVRGDAVLLVDVFQNLVQNAIKYRSEEPVRVEIAARSAGDAWQVSVRDNGIGIADDDRERVFQFFTRLGRNEAPGMGVGLAHCRRIVEKHGGRIWCESAPDGGTVFHFTLPAAD